MKYLRLLAFFVAMLLFSSQTSFAATADLTIDVKTEVPPNTSIAIPISVKSSDRFNAFTLEASVANATLENATFDASTWSAVVGPKVDADAVSFTGALLKANGFYTGKKELIVLQLKTPAEGEVTISYKGQIALLDDAATKVDAAAKNTTLSIKEGATLEENSSSVSSLVENFMANPVALYGSIGVTAALFFLILFLVFRKR